MKLAVLLLISIFLNCSALAEDGVKPGEVECFCQAAFGKEVLKDIGSIGMGQQTGDGCVRFCVTRVGDNASGLKGDAERICHEGKKGDIMARAKAGNGIWKTMRSGYSIGKTKDGCKLLKNGKEF